MPKSRGRQSRRVTPWDSDEERTPMQQFFTQKHGSLRLEHVWCREYGAMKMHFWLIQLADLIQTLHMLYDLAASQAYSCYKDFVKELARSFTRDSLDAPGIREFIVKRRKMFKHTG